MSLTTPYNPNALASLVDDTRFTARHKEINHPQRENVPLEAANEPVFHSYWNLSETHEQEYKALKKKGQTR